MHRLQIVGQWRDEFHPPLIARMMEDQAGGMQKWSLESLNGADVAGHAAMDAAVHRVADDRMSNRAEVYADLVRSPGVDRDLTQRQSRQVMCARNARHRVPCVPCTRGHLLPVDGVPSDRGVDAAPRLHNAPHERDVFLLDLAVVELPRELLMCGVVLRHHHES